MEESASENRISSLVDICSDENINSDAHLLDAIQKAFNNNELSVLLKPHAKKSRLFIEVRKGVKKRMKQAKSNTTIQESDEKRNMFDLFM